MEAERFPPESTASRSGGLRFASSTYPIGNTPEEFSAQIVRERGQWAKVVKEAGIKPE